MSKRKDITVMKVKLLPSGEVAALVKEESLDLLPSCAKLVLATMIGMALQSGSSPLEVMQECKNILEEAWNENGIDWLIENVDEEQNRRDRMGL